MYANPARSGRLKRLLAGLCALVLLSACGDRSASYTAIYEQQLRSVRGAVLTPAAAQALAQRFVDTFARLGTADFLPAAEQLLSPDMIYVNDVLTSYGEWSRLREHLAGMNESVSAAQVDLVDSWQAGDSVYVHWRMEYTLTLLGGQRRMASYGISQLKTDAAGRIVFQQDFWDSNNGLYRQLPTVGWLYRWLLPVQGL